MAKDKGSRSNLSMSIDGLGWFKGSEGSLIVESESDPLHKPHHKGRLFLSTGNESCVFLDAQGVAELVRVGAEWLASQRSEAREIMAKDECPGCRAGLVPCPWGCRADSEETPNRG
jgi:hypothetical protein